MQKGSFAHFVYFESVVFIVLNFSKSFLRISRIFKWLKGNNDFLLHCLVILI